METAAAIGMESEAGALADFEAVVQLYRPRIFRFALASLRDRDAAESVTQDCFLRAYHARDRFRGEASLQTWLMQIAVNLVRDASRSRRWQFWKRAEASAVDLDVAGEWLRGRETSPEARASARQQVAAVWIALEGLSEKQRTVFLLHFLEEMSGAEIAAATGISRAAIKVHLFRAVHTVREKLGKVR
jgi:RNA polymerase sigma-70 factor (ECF subfamily)